MVDSTREGIDQRYLTVKNVSSLLSYHQKTIYKLVEDGRIPFIRLNGQIRFSRKDIEQWINDRKYIPVYPPSFHIRPDISLAEYDKILLKGDSAVSKKKQRWNYGKKGVYKRKLKSGFSWCYWYYDEKGNRRKVTVRNATCKEDAIMLMEAAVRESFNNQHGIQKKSITFNEFAPIYLERYAKKRKKSWKTDEKYLKTRLIPYFGDMQLTEITPEHVDDFIISFKPKRKDMDNVKGSTINKHLQVLSRIINVAKKYGYETSKNPVQRDLHFFKETTNRRERVMSRDEEERLMQTAAPHLKPIIQCAVLQLMRLQEILELRVNDIDLKKDTLTIRPDNNKTGKLDVIPIRVDMKKILERLIAENNGRTSYVFNYLDPRTGKFRPIKSCQHAFQAACCRAGIKKLQFRDLRRTGATRLHEKEVDPLIIQRLLRHSSFKISEEVYIQSNLKMLKDALDKTDQDFVHNPKSRRIWNTIGTRDKEKENRLNANRLFSWN